MRARPLPSSANSRQQTDPSIQNAPWCSPLLFLLPHVAACNDELGGRLVISGLLSFGRKTPRRHWMTAAGGAAFSAAMGVIDRIHRDTAIVRPPPEPTSATG